MLAPGSVPTPAAGSAAGDPAAGPAQATAARAALPAERTIQHHPGLARTLPYLGVYLFYLATVARGLRLLAGRPWQNLALALLAAYGVLLVLEPRLTAGRRRRAAVYLLVQTGLAVGLQAIPPRLEVLSTLFVPLSLQAVLFFGWRVGSAWIAAFVVAIFVPVTREFGRGLTGVAMVAFYGAVFVLIGYFAGLIRNAEAARAENERLIDELRAAHVRLEEHARQAEQAATAGERRRMARELHDSATQTIFGMNMAVQAARVLWERQPEHARHDPMAHERVAEQLDRLQQLAQAATGEIQALAQQLQPLEETRRGLAEAVQRIASERAERDGLAVHVEIERGRELPEAVQAGLCRILQEALNNVAKHAGAREAWVRLNLAGLPAWLEVEDKGAGFDPEAPADRSGGHLGLAGMAERAREIGWEFRLDSYPGRGTCIRVEEGR